MELVKEAKKRYFTDCQKRSLSKVHNGFKI